MTHALLLALLAFSSTPDEAPAPEEAPARPSIKVTLTREKPCPGPEDREYFGCVDSQVVYEGIAKSDEVVDITRQVQDSVQAYSQYFSEVRMAVELLKETDESRHDFQVETYAQFMPDWRSHEDFHLEGFMVKESAWKTFSHEESKAIVLPSLTGSSVEIDAPRILYSIDDSNKFIEQVDKQFGLYGLCSAAEQLDVNLLTKLERLVSVVATGGGAIYDEKPVNPTDSEILTLRAKCLDSLHKRLPSESVAPLYRLHEVHFLVKGRESPDVPMVELLHLKYTVYWGC